MAGIVASIACASGLYIGLYVAPSDHQQGEVYRIIYLHVPAAWMSMIIYVAMGLWAVVGLVMGTKLSHLLVRALAPTGLLFTALALITGSIWGRPVWGTWWVWDARLTSELILLFLYIGVMGIHASLPDGRAEKVAAIFSLVGLVNIPLIYFSVRWWNTLHQAASIRWNASSVMDGHMVSGIALMVLAAWSYSIFVAFRRLAFLIQERDADFRWHDRYGVKEQ